MARVTVEDCLLHVENRFDLVLKAAKRAHALELGEAEPQVSFDNDKPTVLALREIALGLDITAANQASIQAEELFSEDLSVLDDLASDELEGMGELASDDFLDEVFAKELGEEVTEEEVTEEEVAAEPAVEQVSVEVNVDSESTSVDGVDSQHEDESDRK